MLAQYILSLCVSVSICHNWC